MQYKGSCHCGHIAYQPKGNPVAAINIRSLENIELEKVPLTHFDGRAL
jgi:hypothetical protein